MDDQRIDRHGAASVSSAPKRGSLRFSLKALFVIITPVAVGIGVYVALRRVGYLWPLVLVFGGVPFAILGLCILLTVALALRYRK
jgi:hypothetical protein